MQTVITTVTEIGGRAVYPDVSADRLVRDAFCGNDAVYTIVNMAAKKFANIPKGVYKDTSYVKRYRAGLSNYSPILTRKQFKAIGEAVDNSEYIRLIKRPNPHIGQDSFLEALYVSKEINGEAFIWINRGDDTTLGDARYRIKPLELYWLPPQNIELITDDNDIWNVLAYTLDVNGVKIRLNKEDIIHWKSFNPVFDNYTRDHLRGLSPLKPGAKLLASAEASKDAQVRMYQSDGAKGLLFNKTLDNLTPQQKDQVQAVINRKINNTDVKGQVATLQGEWGYINFGQSSIDMQLLQAQSDTFSRLCNLYRVSPNLFLAGQTRDNLREARKDLITNKIMPDVMSLDDELNRVLSGTFGGQIIVSDFSNLPEMQYEMGDMNIILRDMYDRGVINANEYREMLGWEATGNGEHEQYYVSSNIMPISEAAMPESNGFDDMV